MSWWQRRRKPAGTGVDDVHRHQEQYNKFSDEDLRRAGQTAASLAAVVAATAIVAERVLGLQVHDEQLLCALELARGRIVEMQTGEGKTLAAVPAVVWLARRGDGVHVLTANDYLAQRDAEWMRTIYAWMGVDAAVVTQQSTTVERRMAYRAAVTYTTAHEVGFDYLRDGLALSRDEQVHRSFAAALLDEADAVLIDEARIPLVIAGEKGSDQNASDVFLADRVVRELVPDRHYTLELQGHNITLTPAGVAFVERAAARTNLFDPENESLHAAVQDALDAHLLLKRDVDYVVSKERVISVDEFKGRVVPERRWRAGLQAAIDVKEGVRRQAEGRVLGSITIEHLIGMYAHVCGMTGTAATQSEELREVYGLETVVIPPHRPVIRVDYADELFETRAEKDSAIRAEIRRVHSTGRPILVGTPSVQDSERLSRSLHDIPHHVLNAKHEAEEAAIIARAGERDALTIATNMAGRGVDIRLGSGVEPLGGLYVIGTHRHDSRRIDHQLRGRAGRQGDPGSSRFFVSREDPIMAKFVGEDPHITPDQCQRITEGQHLDMRIFLRKYESILEGQRQRVSSMRQDVLTSDLPPRERTIRLTTIDDLWSDYLAAASELRSGTAWVSLAYGDPLRHYIGELHKMFASLEESIAFETEERLRRIDDTNDAISTRRGATWTYLTTDDPFGSTTQRIMANVVRRLKRRA